MPRPGDDAVGEHQPVTALGQLLRHEVSPAWNEGPSPGSRPENADRWRVGRIRRRESSNVPGLQGQKYKGAVPGRHRRNRETNLPDLRDHRSREVPRECVGGEGTPP